MLNTRSMCGACVPRNRRISGETPRKVWIPRVITRGWQRDIQDWLCGGRARWLATFIWMGTLIVISIAVWRTAATPDPKDDRTVTTNYRVAAEHFWSAQPMYSEGQHGWLYPPQGAVVYSPFAMIPSVPLGEVLWRVVITGLYGWALWRLAGLVSRITRGQSVLSEASERAATGGNFLLLTAGSIALAAGCMRNGQMNLPLGAMFILAGVAIAEKKWWPAALWMGLAVAAKPIAVPVVMVMGAIVPRLWWRLAVVMIGVLALPYVNPDWGYVTQQYQAALAKMREAGEPGAGVFSEMNGMLRMMPGLGSGDRAAPDPIGPQAMTLIRAGMGLVTLVLAALAIWRIPSRERAVLVILTLCISYLMLFNPRTEGNSYVMLAPLLAAWVAVCWVARRGVAFAGIVGLILLASAHEFHKDKLRTVWVRPMIAAVMMAGAGWAIVRESRRVVPRPSTTES